MMRKLFISMTLISLVVLSTTSLSFGKESSDQSTRKCSYIYIEVVQYEGRTLYIPHTVDLGVVSNNEIGDAVCDARIKAHKDSFHNDL